MKEDLIELKNQLMNLADQLGELAEEFEPGAEEEAAPESEFNVGDVVDIACVSSKTGEMEFLTGTVFEIECRDEHGWYDRITTADDRKFRIPMNLEDTRLSTRVLRKH